MCRIASSAASRARKSHLSAPCSQSYSSAFVRAGSAAFPSSPILPRATAAAPLGTQNLLVSSRTRMSGAIASGCLSCARAIAAQTQTKFGSLRASIKAGTAAGSPSSPRSSAALARTASSRHQTRILVEHVTSRPGPGVFRESWELRLGQVALRSV